MSLPPRQGSGQREPWPPCEHREDVAPFLLGALEPAEADSFASHLATCSRCAEELAALRPAADALGQAVPSVPLPSELRGRIMSQVRSEAELLHAAGSGADRTTRSRRSRSRGRARLRLASLPARRVGAAAASLALACGVALGVVLSGGGTPAEQTVPAQIADIPHGASAELIRSAGRAELVVAGLPQPPPGRIYQVWLQRGDGSPQPTDSLFSVSRSGDGRAVVPGDLRGVHRVMVTAEPLGGSVHPTRPPVLVATI